MSKRNKKKPKGQLVKYEYNSISQDCMVEIQAEAYYRALKRIEQEKSELKVPTHDKEANKWQYSTLFKLNVLLWPWKINKRFSINEQIYDSILVAFVSTVLEILGSVMWLLGIYVIVSSVYKIITGGLSITLMTLFIIAMPILIIGSTFVISGDKFSRELDSYKIYAYSASVIALISCVVSIIAILIKI